MVTRNVLLVVIVCLVGSFTGLAQTNTIQLRNGTQTTTILPSRNTVRIQIPDIPEGETVYLNTSNVAPVTTTGGGGMLYGTSVIQNSLGLSTGSDNSYLFYVSYGSASDGSALGARINSSAQGSNYAATGLTLAANATGTGNATGLTLSATSGSGREDALLITDGALSMKGGSSGQYYVSFLASTTMTDNSNYVWPANDGGVGRFLTIDDDGIMSWATLGSVSASSPTLYLDNVINVMYNHSAKTAGTLLVGHELTETELGIIDGLDGAFMNVGVGDSSMHKIQSADYNVGVGHAVLKDLTTGSGNVVLGMGAGAGLTTGSDNIFIGHNAGPLNAAGATSNKLYIDDHKDDTPLIYGDLANDALTINGTFTSTGNVYIGTTSDGAELRLYEPNGSGTNYNAFKTIAQSNTYTYSLPTDTPASNEVLKVTSVSGSDVVLEWGLGTTVVVEGALSTNSTLRWDGTKWVENSGVTSNGTNLSVSGGTISTQSIALSETTNQLVLGTTKTTTISAVAPSSSRTYTIPDAGANASFVMTEGAQTINGNKTLSGTTSINGGASAAEIRFYEPSGSGTNYTAFKAGVQSSDVTYTLPLSDGTSGSMLVTNGSGSLSWSSAPAALTIDNLSDAKSGGTDFTGSVILGHQTTGTLSAANNNTAVGIDAMKSLTSGHENTAVGNSALKLVNSGLYNSAVGQGALQTLSSGTGNSALGQNALYSATTSSQNTSVGYTSGFNVTTGAINTFLGHESGFGVKTGSGNIGIGYGFARNGEESGHSAADVGSYNIAIGYAAMYNGPSLNDNIGIGYYALNAAFDAANNIGIGKNTGLLITSGDNNTILGYNAGSTLTTGSSNVFIGYNVASAAASDASNLLYIDNSSTASPLIYGDFSTDALTINGTTTSTGNVYVGTSTGQAELRFYEPSGDGTNYNAFKTIAQANTYTYSLPTDTPASNEVLKVTSVSGSSVVLEWGTGGADLSSPGVIGSTTPNSANFTSVNVTNTTNQLVLGTSPNTLTINSVAPSGAATYTIPNVGASASFVMTEGAQTVNGVKTFGSAPNLSSLTASKPLKLDASKNITSAAIGLANSDGEVTGVLPAANGGTGISSYTAGDILYASGATTLSKLAKGTDGQVLTLSSGVPSWGSGMPTGTTTNSTLRWNGTSWVENTGVLATSDGTTTLKATANQVILGNAGVTNTTTINASTPASGSRTYSIPDAGANASFVMTAGSQTIGGTKTFSGPIIALPGSLSNVAPAATPGNSIGSFTGLYNKVTITAPTANQFVKLPAGTDGQIVYLKISFTAGASAFTVTVVNSDASNTNTALVYDGAGSDYITAHMIYDSATTRWTILSAIYNP